MDKQKRGIVSARAPRPELLPAKMQAMIAQPRALRDGPALPSLQLTARSAPARPRVIQRSAEAKIVEQLQKRQVGEIDHDWILENAYKTSQEVQNEGACGALCTAFVMLGLTSTSPDWTGYFKDPGEMTGVVFHQAEFRKLVLQNIDAGYDYLFNSYFLRNLGEYSSLSQIPALEKKTGILCTFEFQDGQERGGHGCACVRRNDDIFVFDPNEGVFKVPLVNWLNWTTIHLLSNYGKITLMTVYRLKSTL